MTKKKNRRPEPLNPPAKVNPLAAAAPVEPAKPEPARPAPVSPSEFDPDLEDDSVSPSLYELSEESGSDDDSESEDEEEDAGVVIQKNESVNRLGNPVSTSFNPRDTSKGFYQGIDPVTGERIYSKPN